MIEPIKPTNEQARLDELRSLALLDTLPEDRFDRITRTARRLFGVKTALVSLIDADRQWFKSVQGLDASELPRGISFCGHAILREGAFIVEDTAVDLRFADNPLVVGAPFIRFYAGMPLHGPQGHRVGTLCIIDPLPRKFGDADVAALADLGALAEVELNTRELRHALNSATASETRLRAVLDNVVEGIITIDELGTIETVNPAAVRIFGYLIDEVIGRNICMLMPEPHHSSHDRYLRNFKETGQAKIIGYGREALGRRKDGSVFPLELAVSEMILNNRRVFSGILRDITYRKQLENAGLVSNRQLQLTTMLHLAILNSANFSIISTDASGKVKIFSAGSERMLGYSASEIIDLQTLALLHEPKEIADRARFLSIELGRIIEPGIECFVAKARSGKADEAEWTYIRKDGSRLPVMLSVTAVLDEGGSLSGFLGIAYDLTERKKLEQIKNEFISTVSHELRTPLTSIRGSLGLLVSGAVGEIPQRAQSLLGIANNNCERLVRLINDILDIEKIESGNMRFNKLGQRILPLIEHAIQATQPYADQFCVKFVLQADCIDHFVSVDADRISQVIVNLLSNAAKFSPTGSNVDVKLEQIAGFVRTTVIDHGSGIAPEFQSRIFQKFAQADSSDTRQKGGTGLGLSISKAIVEKHNGKIDFETEAGVGTAFYFELPSDLAPKFASQAHARILICEDDPDIARLLNMMLKQTGFSSDIACDAVQARALLNAGQYEAMTLDLNLPGENGFSLLNWIRANEKTADLPVVVVSAAAEQGRDKLIGGAVHVVDWLTKPIDEAKLLKSLRLATMHQLIDTPVILHVEDDLDVAKIVATLLGPTTEVTHAPSVSIAMEKLVGKKFSLIILDLGLPDGTGLDLLSSLPALNAGTPVMVFSAEEATQLSLGNVSAALVKSRTSNEQLLATIQALIGKRHAE